MYSTAAGRITLAIAVAWAAAHGSSLKASQGAPAVPLPDAQNTERNPLPRDRYVGDEVCASCHKDKAATFSKTAHHLTSRVAAADSVAGAFHAGANILETSNPGLLFRMEAKNGRFYETAVWGVPPSTTSETKPIDVAIGSGRKGQTYLYWKGDRLFELPVSYWVELGHWFNTPGNTDGWARFDQPVMARCLECHGTYADNLSGPQPKNRFEKTTLVLGISCERCHGPGREHVARHQSGNEAAGEAIVNPAKLSRDADIDVCAQCHAGMRYPIAPAFSFVAGARLDEYLDPDRSDANSTIDVHGGQVALLRRSNCYRSSATMTCSTCHDVHQAERDVAALSGKCLSCHKTEDCGMFRKRGNEIAGGCVECHMPLQQSKAIVSVSNGKRVAARVRTHWIKVYADVAASTSEGAGSRKPGTENAR